MRSANSEGAELLMHIISHINRNPFQVFSYWSSWQWQDFCNQTYISIMLPLSSEMLHLYRSLFRYVKALIIDEISMISAELLAKIGGIDVILIGDLRQAPPVRASLLYKPIKSRIVGPHLWQSLALFKLTQVMRQAKGLFIM